jgi:hypothetical protein
MKRGKRASRTYSSADIFVTALVVIAFLGSLVLSGQSIETGTSGTGHLKGTTYDCADTDGGKNINVKGQTTGTDLSGNSVTLSDVCEGEKQVREAYCSAGKVVQSLFYCGTGCQDGACAR